MHQHVHMTSGLCIVVCQLKKKTHTRTLLCSCGFARKKCEIQKNMNKKMRIINSMVVIPHRSVNI